MRNKQLKLGAVLLLSLGLTGLQAQKVIPATGGEVSGGGGSVSYTIGQVVYTTNTGTNGSVAQGVQQPYEISMVTGIERTAKFKLELTVYPNPTVDHLILKIGDKAAIGPQMLSYRLYDINGRLLKNKKITSKETSIDMEKYRPATYFLEVTGTKSGGETINRIATFKIIKK